MTLCDRCINYPCSNNDIKLLKYCPAFNPKKKPITNADRIRSMTDEELAKWISEEYYVPHCPTGDGCPDDLGDHGGCNVCWMKWLKEEI